MKCLGEAELLAENNRLRVLLIQCRKYIKDSIEYAENSENVIGKQGRKLIQKLDDKP